MGVHDANVFLRRLKKNKSCDSLKLPGKKIKISWHTYYYTKRNFHKSAAKADLQHGGLNLETVFKS